MKNRFQLSAVTSAPELPHNKTRWFQKNDSRVDFSISLWNRIFSLARAHEKLDSLLLEHPAKKI
jgi:hypothetical protein